MSKLTIVKESKEEFVIEGAEYEALYTLIYVAYNDLCGDLDDKDLSDISSIALSRELDIFRKLKQIVKKENTDV
tara:strand:- start:109 stop:330 length:222 start_codon:yes stop_codon:yes gene_type:complete